MNIARPLSKISIVMPCLDEARRIGRAISSLLERADDDLELIVVDGGSQDETRDIVEVLAGRDGRIRILHNPHRRVSAAMNIGIREARGEWIVRADAHCVYPPGYARRCVELLAATGAANAGGVQVPVAEIDDVAGNKIAACIDPEVRDEAGAGRGATGDKAKAAQGPAFEVKNSSGVRRQTQLAVALAMRHALGSGNARWRRGRRSGFVDTVYLGVFRRSLFDEIGFFDDEADANQDAELNMRIRAAGKTVYLDHTLEVLYCPRGSFRGLARQYFRYGQGRARTALKHRRLTSWRQAASPLLLIGLGGSLVAALWKPVFLLVPAAYAVGLAAVALLSRFPEPVRRDKGDKGASAGGSIGLRTRLQIAIAWAVMHISWGAGFLGRLIIRGKSVGSRNAA